MKKSILQLALVVSVITTGTLSLAGQGDFGLVNAKGFVKRAEVGGAGLYVFSMWDHGRNVPIGEDGRFSVAILSSARPQKISVRDAQDKTRALALVLSQEAQDVSFDALSTAMAIVFGDPSTITNAQEMKKYLAMAEQRQSFQDFVVFLKANLPLRSIEELVSDETYVALFEKCNREIFNEDRAAIHQSLYEAQGQLEKSFYEK